MVKKIFTIVVILFVFNACFFLEYKTKYGRIRFRYYRFSIKPNIDNKVYEIIDTSKIYNMVDLRDVYCDCKSIEIENNLYLKFYSDGRFGEFKNYDENNISSLDPKRANIGIYNYDKGRIILQFYFRNVHGASLINEEIIKIKNDTLELNNGRSLTKYKALPLPKEFFNI